MRRRVTWLLVPLAWALACGGKFEQTTSGDGEPGTVSTGQGGSASPKAGSSSSLGSPTTGTSAGTGRGGSKPTGSGGATASGGVPFGSGGAAVAGTFGTAGTFAVGVGGTLVVGTGGTGVTTGGFPTFGGDACGFAGEPGIGGDTSCAPVDCARGFVLVRLPNGFFQCQPESQACDPQRQNYRQFRQLLLDKYSSYSCNSDAECVTYYEKNACGVSSCGISIAKALWANFDNNLNSYAQMNCNAACPPEPEPPCDPAPAQCFKGYCN